MEAPERILDPVRRTTIVEAIAHFHALKKTKSHDTFKKSEEATSEI